MSRSQPSRQSARTRRPPLGCGPDRDYGHDLRTATKSGRGMDTQRGPAQDRPRDVPFPPGREAGFAIPERLVQLVLGKPSNLSEVRATQVGATQVRSLHVRLTHVRPRQACVGKDRIAEIRVVKVSFGEGGRAVSALTAWNRPLVSYLRDDPRAGADGGAARRRRASESRASRIRRAPTGGPRHPVRALYRCWRLVFLYRTRSRWMVGTDQ